MNEISEYRGISAEDVQAIRAIIQSLYGEEIANRFTTSSISEDTIHQVAILLAETTDCSQWVDAVPNPKDLLMPAKSMQKWALRLVRNAGKPFINGTAGVTVLCKNFRALQFKSEILNSLKH